MARAQTQVNFDTTLAELKQHLSYVEDDSFKWDDVAAILVIELNETDSKNKTRDTSNATNIQITDSVGTQIGSSKTEDFFPTLTVNTTFSRWRLSVNARINKSNIEHLKGNDPTSVMGWIDDNIEIKRRPNLNNGQNPVIHICYLDDLDPLRDQLWPKDYLVIVKQKKSKVYEAFGVKSTANLGIQKKLYVSPNADRDETTFDLSDIIPSEFTYFIRVFDTTIEELDKKFNIIDSDPSYLEGDEIWAFDKGKQAITHILEVKLVSEEAKEVEFKIKNSLEKPLKKSDLEEIDEFPQEILTGLFETPGVVENVEPQNVQDDTPKKIIYGEPQNVETLTPKIAADPKPPYGQTETPSEASIEQKEDKGDTV
jgi:hypothetical protein